MGRGHQFYCESHAKVKRFHFTGRGSSIYAAFLDISTAIDIVNHYKLMYSLMKVHFPKCLVAVLNTWCYMMQ